MGACFAIFLMLVLLSAGIILVYSRARYDTGFFRAEGIIDICLALSLWLLLSLCWYTIDPVALR